MMGREGEPLLKRTAGNPLGMVTEVYPQMKINTVVDHYHTIHKTGYFAPYDPYFDCFVLFHPGFGHPASSASWVNTLPLLLETKVPIICTGYNELDMERDLEWVKRTAAGELDVLLQPGENRFRSLRWDINDLDPQDITCANWGVWVFRGKRYHFVFPSLSSAITSACLAFYNLKTTS
jgi:splicing suppressor protein 51